MKKLLLIVILLIGCAAQTPTTPLKITTQVLPVANINEFYQDQLEATGGTNEYSWSIVSGSLPTGITLSSAGVLFGTPTQSGSFTFSVEVQNATSVAELEIKSTIN